MALGLKEMAMKQATEERVKYLREHHKAWMKPEFKIEVNWDSFEGFAAAVGNQATHAVSGHGSVGTMMNDVTDAIKALYENYKKLGDAGVALINSKITGIRVQADDSQKLNVTVDGTTIVAHVPKGPIGNWSRGADEFSTWRKVVATHAES